jgi:putative PIN family toxin of toxin-antitoxin system
MLYTAEEILEETREVLLERGHIRRRYSYSDEQVERFMRSVRGSSTVVTDLPILQGVTRDPEDDMIVACAVAANADYIVSRDRDLLDLREYQGIEIVSPEAFMQILRAA